MTRTIEELRESLLEGHVIPACPLALTRKRTFDERHQRALIRYYMAAGAGGLAVGVHTTQFAIHTQEVGLYWPLLELAMEEMAAHEAQTGREVVKVAGLVGDTDEAMAEATLAACAGYDCGLISLSAFKDADEDAMIAHCRAISEVIPLFGFYLQPAVGGRVLPYRFWRRFMEIENVAAIKIAPFNRYQTLDVVRALWKSGRAGEIALYTGNDDAIIYDLLTEFTFEKDAPGIRFAGGLLGHWAAWTHAAVELLDTCKAARTDHPAFLPRLLTVAAQVTDCNAALFDAANGYAGCIAGIHEVLARQGLMAGTWTLDPDEALSPGQKDEIDRVHAAYPHLTDDVFVELHLDEWLS